MVYFSIASNIGSYITEARSSVDITVPTDARCFGTYTCTYRCTLLRYVHMYLPMHAASVDIHVPTEALPFKKNNTVVQPLFTFYKICIYQQIVLNFGNNV